MAQLNSTLSDLVDSSFRINGVKGCSSISGNIGLQL
jgi:hypothetical protein